VDLPADLVAWWRRANGSASSWSHQRFDLLPIYCPCRIEHALDRRQVWWQVWHDQMIERGWLAEETSPGLNPIPQAPRRGCGYRASCPSPAAAAGQTWFVDLRSGPMYGCVREFDRVSTDGKPRWANVTAMLADIAHALENHSPIDGSRAHLNHDGTLYWDRRIH
jgi:hypothetical protein